MTSKPKKKKVDFIVRPKPTKEDLPPTPEEWVEEGKGTDARPEKPADDRPNREKEKRLTLNLPAKMHTAFKGLCVFEGITIQDKVQRLIERELDARRTTETPAQSLL